MASDAMTSMVNNVFELEGWESLDAGKALDNEQATEAARIARMIANTFNTQEGQECLKHLIKITLLRPTVTDNATQFQAGIREGRADLVRQIMSQIEVARGLPK